MKTFLFTSLLLVVFLRVIAQSAPKDSVTVKELQEVIVLSRLADKNTNNKLLSTLDTYLSCHEQVDLVKRGAYAWEPLLNGMATERSVITIDGMRIYGACTDKMDPVTSYVETTNLSKAVLHSGQSGSVNGATIAGSIDLVRKKAGFGDPAFSGSLFNGMEFNNRQRIIGTDWQWTRQHFFADFDFTYRKAGNYTDGDHKEVAYSQFSKFNLSTIIGYKLNAQQHLELSLIVDRAKDVGYPALPMDVSAANALIGSVSYLQHPAQGSIKEWETKLYFNRITHVMDDSKRPDLPVRMDMPGWSTTSGWYTAFKGAKSRHAWKSTVSMHHNRSLAEMTMFSNEPGQKDMYMLTWPDIHTIYAGFFAEDAYAIAKKWKLTASVGAGIQQQLLKNEMGIKTMQIFYPDMPVTKNRVLKNAGVSLRFQPSDWQFSLGLSYAERAPSVSEGYGFYLFNSFDRYDYIGNPGLRKERSVELNSSVTYRIPAFELKWQQQFFRIQDYIIGMPQPAFIPMTIGASGIKVYQQLGWASLYNSTFTTTYQLLPSLQVSGKAVYRKGVGKGGLNLPLIQPFSYGATCTYRLKKIQSAVNLEGALKQSRFSPAFGETAAPSYTILNLSGGYTLAVKKIPVILRAGVENLLNRTYTSFADWNRIPRMGRNIYVNWIISL